MQGHDSETASQYILWDVIEEHLDEAGFLFSQWERGLFSPLYTQAELGTKIESRMLAHLDGLQIGGRPVIDRVLLPALESKDLGHIFAAAFVLASSEFEDVQDRFFTQIEAATPDSLEPIRRALELAPRTDSKRLLRPLHGSRTEFSALALDVLSFRRAEKDELIRILPLLLVHEDPQMRASALRAARRLPSSSYRGALRTLLGAPGGGSVAALEAALLCGLVEGRSLSSWLDTNDDELQSAAQLLLALVGTEADLQRLRRDLNDERRQRGALFALGFSGSIAFVEAILDLMRTPELAALAGEALSGITGVDLEKAGLLTKTAPKKADEELSELTDPEADLSLPVEADLPVPDPDAAAAWWQANRNTFDSGARYVQGLLYQGEQTLLEALSIAPMRRRHALARDLAMRSQGRLHMEPTALTGDWFP